jgi:ribonucleoside-triphosphate reductase
MIVEEVLRQRLEGIKNEAGVYVTPAFPKLIYVLDENNSLKGGRYDYITKLAVKCSSKRMYPDYISAKKMRENYEGNVFSCMGCRSFLSTWKDENGNYKFEGRFNQGVVSINLPQIGILANGDEETFWKLLEERLSLSYEALMCRHKSLEGTLSDVSPIHWQYGAIARLKKGETIDRLLKDGYSTISLGYIGLFETTKLMKGKSHTTEEGEEFALRVMNRMKDAVDQWKAQTGLGFGLYGTPAESLCYRFAKIDRERFGIIPDVTDKGYYTNSYHVDVRENIDAFRKFTFESQFQEISSGGAISYVEVPNMSNNLEAMEEVVKFIYDNIQYAEFNTKSDYCQDCGFDGEIIINDDMEWECPQCHNKDKNRMNVTRRTCGYLGENFWNTGKTKEIKSRVLHL